MTNPLKPHLHTVTRRIVDPLNPKSLDIDIEDIAHGLSNINRFVGQTQRPISVAQHSVYVARLCANTPFAMQGLLHDASEAYLGDVSKWLKESPLMEHYRELERVVEKKILQRFGCPWPLSREVEEADRLMVLFEGKRGIGDWFTIPHPNYAFTEQDFLRVGKWQPWSWRQAKEAFLLAFRLIQEGRFTN